MSKIVRIFISLIKLLRRNPAYLFHLIGKKIRFNKRYKWVDHNSGKDGRVPPPLVYKVHLTHQCNLKCKMCMLWGEQGWVKNESTAETSKEIDWPVLERCIKQVSNQKPSFIFSGGEPFLYSKMEELIHTLKANKCPAIFCTNGTLLNKYTELLINNPYVSLLVSLDGCNEENDLLRGKGVYNKVIDTVKALRKKSKNLPYIGMQFTIQPENVHSMYTFCEEMSQLGVNWILFNLCWFINENQARKYVSILKKDYSVTPKTHTGYLFSCSINKDELKQQFVSIQDKKWPMQVSSYFKESKDIDAYIENPEIPFRNELCYKQWIRMEITPAGDVTPCIQFPDLTFGNIADKNVNEIWNNPLYKKFRNDIRKRLLPVCSKCDALYLYDPGRKYL